jgi:hypothetical protein
MRTIILTVLLLVTTQIYAKFDRVGNSVVDSKTDLVWQDHYSDNSGDIAKKSWSDAITYCEDRNESNYNDWRLPNKKELLSILAYTNPNAGIDNQFTQTGAGEYWSSSSYPSDTTKAWVVDFDRGDSDSKGKVLELLVRCVRGGA